MNVNDSIVHSLFDTGEFHVMIVAKKFQTGFDQPKLCAMYVDKKLGGLECVQTLSRLNRTFPGKEETYVLDFFNDPEDVTQFSEGFYIKSKSNVALSNVCRPGRDRWQNRFSEAKTKFENHKKLFQHAKSLGDPTFIANTEGDMKETKKELDALGIRDKVKENERVMNQIANNSPEQALLGDFSEALDDAVMSSGEVHQNQMAQYLNNPALAAKFQRVIFDLLLAKGA